MGVHLILGDDPSLVGEAVTDLVHRLVGDGDRTLMVDDFDADADLAAVADAAQTPPFLTDHRVVVLRGLLPRPPGGETIEQIAPILHYLADPLPSTHLVLTATGRMPKALTDAVAGAGGEVVRTGPTGTAKDLHLWVTERASHDGLRLRPVAAQRIAAWMGEDAGRLAGLIDTLLATYGHDAQLDAGEVEPFLGEAGGVPPWDLTDAIDAGDTTRALVLMKRMIHGGERHPLAVMAILHGHYAKMLQLDGRSVSSDVQAAEILGGKPFPAGKALRALQRIGSGGLQRAIELLAQADLDLRGARDWPDDLVMEVLVARLSRLVPVSARRR